MMGWSSGCYIPSFVEIGPPVPEKKILTGFYHIGAWRPSWSCDQHHVIRFSFPESFHTKFGSIGTVVSGKIKFEFLYVHDLWPRSRNDLDFQYSHTFIYSIRSQLQLPFRSLAAIVSENPLYSFFPREKPKLPNLTLP